MSCYIVYKGTHIMASFSPPILDGATPPSGGRHGIRSITVRFFMTFFLSVSLCFCMARFHNDLTMATHGGYCPK